MSKKVKYDPTRRGLFCFSTRRTFYPACSCPEAVDNAVWVDGIPMCEACGTTFAQAVKDAE